MDSGNYISIGAAVISTFSLSVSYLTWRQKNVESKRTIRNQLTDAISKLDAVFAEWDKLIFENAGKEPEPYYLGRRSFLNGQKRFMAKQTLYLLEHIPELATDFEYNRIADAFSSIGDYTEANKLYEEAIKVANVNHYKANCIKAYARSLFNQGNIIEGRKQFHIAVETVPTDNNFHIYHKAETYQRWANVENDNLNYSESISLIKKARETYLTITNKIQRNQGLKNLEMIEKSINQTNIDSR